MDGEPSPQHRRQCVALVEARPDPALIAHIERALEDARAGRLRGFLVACHYGADDMRYSGYGSLCLHPALGLTALSGLARTFSGKIDAANKG